MSAMVLLIICLTGTVEAVTIFYDVFDGSGSVSLNGITPDQTSGGATWVASQDFKADGAFAATAGGSATLAFTPVSGRIYTLDCSLSGVSGDADWFALGFAAGQSSASGTDDRFIQGNVIGKAWMFIRGDASVSTNNAFLGSDLSGTVSGAAWTTYASQSGGAMLMRIVLDTTGGAGHWNATWYVKKPVDADYAVVRPITKMLSESINSVGFAISSPTVSGTIVSFSLSDDSIAPIGWSAQTTTAVTTNSALASATVNTDLTETVLVWDTSDQGIASTNDWTYRRTLGAWSAGAVSGQMTNLVTEAQYAWRLYGVSTLTNGWSDAVTFITDSVETSSVPAYLTGPYAVDSNTLHLWHMDEADPGPAQPALGVSNSFSLTPAGGATLQNTAFTGFDGAGNTVAASGAGFQGSAVPVGSVTSADGAFTFEALINVENVTNIQQIIAMDNGGANSARPFQFRIDADTATGAPATGALRFINIAGTSGIQSLIAPIPVTGGHAFVSGRWFHVAATYNGSENTPANIKFYWTRMDAGSPQANEIGSASMVHDLSGISTTLGVGNEYRGTPDNNLRGRIDEIRISAVARTPDDFLFQAPDIDMDVLADAWEIFYFRETPEESDEFILAKYDGADDPDLDGYDNAAEYIAGTDPTDPLHTPDDADRDGYLDAWEIATFGTTAYGPNDDPDGDGCTTAEELAAGSDPADAFSTPFDSDADGMDDAIEIALFGDLSQGAFDDFDNEGVPNHAELAAGTDPADSGDWPLVSFIPVTDGNSATDENGYAGSSINSVAFIQNNLITTADRQFIAYYRRHATDSGATDNNTIIIGRRSTGELRWELFATDLYSYNINDTHNVICFAIDGDGVMHMSWGMHGNSLLYARSTASVLGDEPITMTSLGTAGMTGQESSVTYPKFQTLADGNVLFLFREGGSGSGDWFLNRYDIDADSWSPVHQDGGGTQLPLLKGRGASPDNCFYPDRMTLGPDGMLHLAGVFRYNSDSPAGEIGYQTNHRYVYMRSSDGGLNWQRSDGSAIDLPAVEAAWFQNLGAGHVPEIIYDLPEGYSIMNESGMTTDSAGRPIIANWWADGAGTNDHTRQYHIMYLDDTGWHRRKLSARDIDNPATKYSEAQLGASRMGRPVVLTDAQDRIIVVYNDNRFHGITAVFSLPLAMDPERLQWTRMNLTVENLGDWETTYDEARWLKDGVLHMLYQKMPGMGESYSAQNNSTPVSVIEWNARTYFGNPDRLYLDVRTTPGVAALSVRTRIGFQYDLKTSTSLDFTEPPVSTVSGDNTRRTLGSWLMDEPRRFWLLERSGQATNDL